jgi:hypothetical protein
MHEVTATIAILGNEKPFVVGISDNFPEPAFFRQAKEKVKITVRFNLESMMLEAEHHGKIVCSKRMKNAPTYDDFCDMFLSAVRIVAKRMPIMVGYTFILE